MKALDWMRHIVFATAPEPDPGVPAINGVLAQYVSWKKNFENNIRSSDPEAPGALMLRGWPGNCPLGHWLSEVTPDALHNDLLLAELKDEYELFYLSTMSVLQQAQEGRLAGALHDLEHGDHVRHSLRIKRLMINLEIRQSRPVAALVPRQA